MSVDLLQGDGPLPNLKKPVKFTPASLRIMQACEKAFASNNFLLLYFSNSKNFTVQFTQPDFLDVLRNKFQFLQLSRSDKAGNWLTTTFHVKSSPYFAIIDPSNGEYVRITYGDMTTPAIREWLAQFLARSPKFALSHSIFPDLIEDTQRFKKTASFSYGTKVRVNFSSQLLGEKIIYVNKVAPLDIAFAKYCEEKSIDLANYYFLFKGVELPPSMTASQFGLRNGSTVYVHPLDDKTSPEPLSVSVVSVDGTSTVFQVTRGRKLGTFLKSYAEISGVNPQQLRLTFNNEVVNEELTFAEHNIKNGDHLYAHAKPYPPPAEFMYHMMNPPEMNAMAPMQMQMPLPMQMPMQMPMAPEQYEMPMGVNPNMMFLYQQNQRTQLPPPQAFNPSFNAPFPMPQPKTVHYQKPHESNQPSIWEQFDMP
jgi:hypothetical protein